MKTKPKIIVIVGPTASGKSDLAVSVAKKIKAKSRTGEKIVGAEVISADSRQVYRGLDIGTGKITRREMKGVPHHLLDVADPKRKFSVAQFVKLANKAVAEILKKEKMPIICGGTGFYIQALVDGVILPDVPPNYSLRKKLEKKSCEELFAELKKKDPSRAKTIDKNNKVRIIRALEIIEEVGSVPKINQWKDGGKFDPIFIGIKTDPSKLREKIRARVLKRMKLGMVAEAMRLHKNELSFKRMRELGLEYKYLADLLEKKISHAEFIEILTQKDWQYAKRQMTWFKKDKRIRWLTPAQAKKFI
ncbi:MAG: tRNA (adenosine(37)-N6)-dimethylallyltransferase MiaA [Magnetococcus sp. WYHC-3]